MSVFRLLASLAVAPIMVGTALTVPAGAALTVPHFERLTSHQRPQAQSVDCRQVAHVHRRCTLWAGGACRRWVTYTHRCG